MLGGGNAAGTALGVLAEKDAKIAQSLADNRATEARINTLLGPVAQAIAANEKEIAVLKAEQAKDKEIMQLKIDNCCCQMSGKIDAVAQAHHIQKHSKEPA